MSGPAFGFSVGDFLTAGKLIVSITKALKEAGGASDEYRSLVQELGLLERILKRLQINGGTGNISVVITQQANLTLATLSGFLKTISKFDAALGKQAPSAWHHGTGRKAQWAVAYAEEIEKLRVKVGTHLNQLNLLLQLQTNTRVESLQMNLDRTCRAVQTHGRNILAWRQEISTGIDNLGSQIHELSISQENLLNKQNSVATQLQSTDNDIRHVSDEITTLGINFESQTTQILALRRDITNRYKDLTAEVQTGSLLTRQGLDALSRKSDLILHTISKTHVDGGSGKQLIRLNDQDEVLLLLFQLLHALSRSMRDLLSKAGLLLPYIFAAVQTLTTTIRREPFLLTQDSINFTDPLGESYTLQYEYFKHWSNFYRFLCNRFRNHPGKKDVTRTLFPLIVGSERASRVLWNELIFPGQRISMVVASERWSSTKLSTILLPSAAKYRRLEAYVIWVVKAGISHSDPSPVESFFGLEISIPQ